MAVRPLRIRWTALSALLLLVGLLHVELAGWLAERAFELGAGSAAQGPQRLRALFVTDLRPAAPPEAAAAPPAAPVPRVRRAAAAPRPAASAPEPAPEVAHDPVADPAADTVPPPEPQPALAQAAAPAASEAVPVPAEGVAERSAPAASAPAAVPFEWPRSTRLSYRLSGYYRGAVDGQASVEWLREGRRYQVHLEVSVGPSFAPLLSRRMSSDGEVGPDGLTPLRYDEETRVALRSPRSLALLFDGPVVRLANGSEVPRPPGVQDTASQFVQLTWLFTTQPQRLRAGQSVDLMLALPRRVEPWTYDVQGEEVLYTPAGVLDTVHVRPRRPARSGDLTAEVWIAPTLQYLPVRIVIRQDSETYVDLLLQQLPQQAAAR